MKRIHTATTMGLLALITLLVVGSVVQASIPTLYAVNDTNLLSIDLNTNASTVVGPVGVAGSLSLTFNGTGTLYSTRAYFDPGTWASYRELRTINTSTGASTLVASLSPTWQSRYEGAAFQPGTGVLYAESTDTGNLVQLDPVTGAATVVGPTGLGNYQVSGLAFDASGVLYGLHNLGNPMFGNNFRLARFDLSTGAGTPIGTDLGRYGDGLSDLSFDTSTNTLYTVDTYSGDIRTIDTTTGLAGPVVFSAAAVGAQGLAFAPVPEPTTAVLLALGSLLAIRRRR